MVPCGQAHASLGLDEHLVPQPGLEVALELGQVEVGAAAASEQLAGVVVEVEAEVEQARRHRAAVHQHVRLLEVPAARPHDQRGEPLAEPVVPCPRGWCTASVRRTASMQLTWPADHIGPGRRQRVLEVRHEDPRARVERVDHHLGLGRAGDLDPPVVEVRRSRRRRSSRPSRTAAVSGSKPGSSPASKRRWRSWRRSSSRFRARPKRRTRCATSSSASGVRTRRLPAPGRHRQLHVALRPSSPSPDHRQLARYLAWPVRELTGSRLATWSSMNAKWHPLPTSTNRCQISWCPNRPGQGSGRSRLKMIAPTV